TSFKIGQMGLLILGNVSFYWRMVLWDQMLFLDAPPEFNLIFFGIASLCILFYYRMYFYRSSQREHGMETIMLVKVLFETGKDPRFGKGDLVMQVDGGAVRKITRKH